MPGLAHADIPSAQVQVCTTAPMAIHAQLSGPNQMGNTVASRAFTVPPREGCFTYANWWWQKGTPLMVVHGASSVEASWTADTFTIPSSFNGAVYTVWVTV
ncbi:hypothetical protein BCF44_12653 [Kutzneria buriramensis]|uniref:Uncharacterized protein n=2 Tax=Kutzneria buriramensis TaxID=1045776 RepID=A0A3E0GUP2_9PSEU|nr:hypothetical protein BCF44_12653 [Kutzneria buriramensis]